jgi:hypothetical protein
MMSLSAAQMQEQLGPVVPVDDDDPSMALALPIVKTYRFNSIRDAQTCKIFQKCRTNFFPKCRNLNGNNSMVGVCSIYYVTQ